MTVCIAAVCENGQKVIAVADRMTVTGQMGQAYTVQREGHARKIVESATNILYMQSGDPSHTGTINSQIDAWISDKDRLVVGDFYEQIRMSVLQVVTGLRDACVRAGLGDGLPFSQLSSVVASTSSGYHKEILQKALQIGIGQFLVAGVDIEGNQCRASLYMVSEDSPDLRSMRVALPYHAIGCGYLHAYEFFEIHKYSIEWPVANSLYAVYCAKRAAELSPGVDKEIDMRIITGTGIYDSGPDVLDALRGTYDENCRRWRQPEAFPLIAQALGKV